MAVNVLYKIPRGTKAALLAAASGNSLLQSQLYHVTDEDRIYLGLSANTHVGLLKVGEAINNGTFTGSTTFNGTDVNFNAYTQFLGGMDRTEHIAVNFVQTTNFANTTPTATVLTATANGAYPNIDGFTPQQGHWILLTGQTLPAENGVYELTTVGNAGTKAVLTRVPLLNTWVEVANANLIRVYHNKTMWILDAAPSGTLGTTAIAAKRVAFASELQQTGVLTFVIDGGGTAIAANQEVVIPDFPFNATITGWTLLGDASGSAVVTVSKATYANFPTFTDISGTEKPTLSTAQKNQDLSLTTWTTTLNQGDNLKAKVDSASTVKQLFLTVRYTRT